MSALVSLRLFQVQIIKMKKENLLNNGANYNTIILY